MTEDEVYILNVMLGLALSHSERDTQWVSLSVRLRGLWRSNKQHLQCESKKFIPLRFSDFFPTAENF